MDAASTAAPPPAAYRLPSRTGPAHHGRLIDTFCRALRNAARQNVAGGRRASECAIARPPFLLHLAVRSFAAVRRNNSTCKSKLQQRAPDQSKLIGAPAPNPGLQAPFVGRGLIATRSRQDGSCIAPARSTSGTTPGKKGEGRFFPRCPDGNRAGRNAQARAQRTRGRESARSDKGKSGQGCVRQARSENAAVRSTSLARPHAAPWPDRRPPHAPR